MTDRFNHVDTSSDDERIMTETPTAPRIDPGFQELFLEGIARGNTMPFVARGTSMERAVRSGTEVMVRRYDDDTGPELFDVVLATRPTFCLHRVIGIRQDGAVLLMGDNTNRPDGWAPREAIVGKAISGKAPGAVVHTPIGPPQAVPPRWVRARTRLLAGVKRALSRS